MMATGGPRAALQRVWEVTGLECLALRSPVVLARRSTLHRMEMNAIQLGRDFERGNPSPQPGDRDHLRAV